MNERVMESYKFLIWMTFNLINELRNESKVYFYLNTKLFLII